VNTLTYLNNLRPALPMSNEKPCIQASNSELRRWIGNGSVLINHERCTWDEEIDFVVHSLVLFPGSIKKRCTLV
jgi:hypothetical protein